MKSLNANITLNASITVKKLYRLEINADKKICNQKEFYTFCLTFLGDAYQLSSGLTYCQQTAKKYYKLIQRGLA